MMNSNILEDSLFGDDPPPPIQIPTFSCNAIKKKPPVLPDDYRRHRKGVPTTKNSNKSQKTSLAQSLPHRPQLHPSSTYTTHTHFSSLWSSAQSSLQSLLQAEASRCPIPSTTDRKTMFTTLTQLFYKYLLIYRKLDEVFDQLTHPQKNILVRKVLEMIIVRLLELRASLVSVENSEFFYFDELCYTESTTPPELDVPIPKFYFHDPPERLLARDSWFEAILARKSKEADERLDLEKRIQAKLLIEDDTLKWNKSRTGLSSVDDMSMMRGSGGGSFEEAHKIVDQSSIILIQAMERGRQGKMRYRLAKYLHDEETRAAIKKRKTKQQQMELGKAIVIIQKIVRGFLARALVRRMREEELELLSLRWTTPNEVSLRGKIQLKCQRDREQLERFSEGRRRMRRLNQKGFEEAQVAILNKLRLLEAPGMAESLKLQLRSWMLDVKETTGKLPDIPKAEFGGSKFFICPNQLPDETTEKGKTSSDKKKNKQDRKKEKQKDKEKKKLEKKTGKKKKDAPSEVVIPTLEPPSQMDDLVAASVEYNKVWRGRSESHNPDQKHEDHFIIDEKRLLISVEVREQVDAALRAELQLLKQALENKKGKKSKKKGKGKGKKGRRSKKGKKRKGKKGKDMTPDRSVESLFQELHDNNIIIQYPNIRLDSLVGTCSLINGEIRSFFGQNPFEAGKQNSNEERPMPGDANPLPSFGDVKRVVKDVAILPMGSSVVHSMSPHVKSLLICGPEGSGKKTLVNAICTELHATLFDLTAANIAGKYPGKPGLKMLMHLIDKVGRSLAPVIIKIDNAEKTYVKKVAKTDKTEPKRLKKQLGKMLKTFIPGDQILLIGLSSEPWACPFKLLKKDYQKILHCPRPDYGSRAEVWRTLLLPHAQYFHQDVHFSLLTKLSEGWTPGVIKKVVDTVITSHTKLLAKDEHDRKYQEEDPFTLMETQGKKVCSVGKRLIRINQFLEELSNYDPLFVEQDKTWYAWFNKTPLQKARIASQTGIGSGGGQVEKKKMGKKKGSKKSKKKGK